MPATAFDMCPPRACCTSRARATCKGADSRCASTSRRRRGLRLAVERIDERRDRGHIVIEEKSRVPKHLAIEHGVAGQHAAPIAHRAQQGGVGSTNGMAVEIRVAVAPELLEERLIV